MPKSSKLILGMALATFIFIVFVAALLGEIFLNMPDFSGMKTQVKVRLKLPNDRETYRMIGPTAPGWVPITQVSQNLLMAVVASEDTSFFSHEGVDYHELREAIRKDLSERRFARGASTITQQVVKNVYLDRSKTLSRKIREFIWARELDKVLTKSQILAFYVNLVEWGPGIYGIRDAANHYFGVSPSELTAKQSAFLAMLLPSPVRYHKYYEDRMLTPWAAKRVGQILHVMAKMKFIDEGLYQVAMGEALWGTTGVIETATSIGADSDFSSLPSDDRDIPQNWSSQKPEKMVPAEQIIEPEQEEAPAIPDDLSSPTDPIPE